MPLPLASSTFPAVIQTGCSLQASCSLEAYPSTGWKVRWLLRGSKSLDIVAHGEHSVHRFQIPVDDTAQWIPSHYGYRLHAERGTQTVDIERGQLRVEPDFSSLPEGYDGRSNKQRALNAINAVLEKRATQDQSRDHINNRELWRTSIPE
ncbi:hypothetical protein LPH50_09555 [Xylella taiwanensis]|uniref:Uncharacterized protein n=1 Tax=Xylella taiwanensis TaxID=1444770 RepID=Z9JLC1_9GAMM|nr:hypothetical protein [Xylella taiwanensis]EWS78798.1 hypothetical protein AF72_04295 [Xylella taiwanensis]MCD8456184.1 hypothetical protein [Xylella taiwanensis]MCD8458592.1 hypothetical protein [Xylella taiwanensis]MCD8460725.1 hypothetical protein [Xylella taiwanensis]MCD8463214.1 hypothetical protein [Xylella taiwanensis]